MEMTLSSNFLTLEENELGLIEGGRNWTATIAGTIAGIGTIGSGVLTFLASTNPRGRANGVCVIVVGVSTIVWAWA